MGLQVGYQVTPHVRLLRLLKAGGMGSVWAAEHLALQTQVAVKFIATNSAHIPAMVTRFKREATYTAQIKSPHVVQVHDHGVTEGGLPFIVMELLEGEALDERLMRGGPLPPFEVAQVLGQLCKVLGRAHQLGIIHRDIKLSNVFLLDADGDVFTKLLDFGVAKQKGDKGPQVTAGGDLVGTVVYMSPEQLNDAREVDARSDLWSLGVVAYRALTGELPFRKEGGLGSLLMAVNAGYFTPVSELRPELPSVLDDWFLRALARDPAERFSNAREMSEAFDVAVGWESPGARSYRSGAMLAQRMEAARHQGRRLIEPTLVDPVELELDELAPVSSGPSARVEEELAPTECASAQKALEARAPAAYAPSPFAPSRSVSVDYESTSSSGGGVPLSKVESSSNTAVVRLQALSGIDGNGGNSGPSLMRVALAGLALGAMGVMAVALLRANQTGSLEPSGASPGFSLGVETHLAPDTEVKPEEVEPSIAPATTGAAVAPPEAAGPGNEATADAPGTVPPGGGASAPRGTSAETSQGAVRAPGAPTPSTQPSPRPPATTPQKWAPAGARSTTKPARGKAATF
ncbi:serine/threonine-protein kinase [Chondromyces crocatus]|uniref:Protein kinase domain-containing protein n=1 Tax=Chondromyces crocatus TaxID=52 RepID=A0A0K1ENZ0_CHOCO|nr:serine/threonine-protein kinase [Chondromyces crocatus]AKT42556.1 uncharacterized protein CMC5_067830 [Chondromyces crocatus]